MRFLYLALVLSSTLFGSTCQYTIYPSDVSGDGFVIDKEGTWCLADDVIYDPTNSNPAITIKASNVQLDLNEKMLTQASKAKPFVVGIAVAPNVTNITISNGEVKNFSQAGIFVNPPVSLELFTTKAADKKALQAKKGKNLLDMAANSSQVVLDWQPRDQVSDIAIFELTAENNGLPSFPFAGVNGMGGIVVFNTVEVTIYECSCLNNYFSGITGVDVEDFVLADSICEESKASLFVGGANTFALGALFASFTTGSQDIVIRNCSFSAAAESENSIGLFFNKISDNSYPVDGVEIEDIEAPIGEDDAGGMLLLNVDNVSLRNITI